MWKNSEKLIVGGWNSMVGWKSSKDLVSQGVYVLESNKQTVSVLKRCLNRKDVVMITFPLMLFTAMLTVHKRKVA